MRFTFLLTALLLASNVLTADPAQAKTITLKDGSTINGQVMSMSSGVYTIKSSFGEIQVPEANVVSIADQATAPAAPAQAPSSGSSMPANYNGQVQAMQAQLMNNPEALNQIQAMAQDPEIMAALSDPAFLQAVQSQNFSAVQSSPQFQKILNNPKMRAIMQSMGMQQ